MGVDISTYRMRIGSFGPRLGKTDVGSIGISTTTLVIIVGALVFIRQLLIMGGIESNPGPPTGVEFNFRYQYLLIEVGTKVLRHLFDHIVNNDFCQFLNLNQAAENQLKFLFLKNIITTDQQQFLPPIDTKPSSTNYDITLLCCLLRNACGLKPINDQSWKNPTATDNSVEANICRLRECRNELMHSGSVFDSSVDLDAKWKYLSKILTDLNNVCKMPDLASLIVNAETMDTDEQLRKQYDQVLRIWHSTDHSEELIHGQTQLKVGQSELKEGQLKLHGGQTKLQENQSQIKRDISEIKQEIPQLTTGLKTVDGHLNDQAKSLQELNTNQRRTIQQMENMEKTLDSCNQRKLDVNESELMNHLITIYNEECSTLPVLPLCEGDDDEKELLSFYQPPSLCNKPYHKSQEKDDKYQIESYREMFHYDDKHFRKVYVTGDAGTGKTSLCKRMVLLWCKAKSSETVSDKKVQNEIDFMAEFDFVFYVSLGAAKCTDIITIIAEQSFCNVNDDKKKLIELILKTEKCLVIMDALDEFNENGKININRLLSDKCAFMITCRPFVIETNRLSPNDIDRQIEITGINGDSIKSYVNEIVNHMNETKGLSKLANDFVMDAHASGLYEQLHIPILGSHLILLWFNHELTHMSQALIYSHIIDMLLERAETVKHVAFSSSPACDVQFPDSLSELVYLKQNATFLKKVCLLSFNLIFKRDKNMSQLVFTKAQLLSKPYHVTVQEMNYLCKFGILSKSKLIGSLGNREHTISFIHMSYIEYFAALFVSSFDVNNEFNNVVQSWKSGNDTLQHKTFFRFYVGLSPTKKIPISGDLNFEMNDHIFRLNTIFQYVPPPNDIVRIQDMVERVFKESRTTYEINMSCLKIEHFVFDISISDNDILKQLVKLNSSDLNFLYVSSDVKSLFVPGQCTYLNEFDLINRLQILVLRNVSTSTIKMFTERLMLKNNSTLHTLCIQPAFSHIVEVPVDIPWKQLNCITSIALCDLKLQHNNYDDLITFLSNNINMENIRLKNVMCNTHQCQCAWTLDLTNKTKLRCLSLNEVNVVSKFVNRSELPNLKFLQMTPLDRDLATHYVHHFNVIHSSQLTCLDVNGGTMLDSNIIKTLFSTIQSLKSIRELRLWYIDIPDDVVLQFHPDVSEIEVELQEITMSKTWFDTFIDTIRTSTSTINIWLFRCKLTTVVGENYHVMSEEESMEYMYNCVIKIPNVKITVKSNGVLWFEKK